MDVAGFLAVATLVVVTPGPDMTLVARNTFAGGRVAGARHLAGPARSLCSDVPDEDPKMRSDSVDPEQTRTPARTAVRRLALSRFISFAGSVAAAPRCFSLVQGRFTVVRSRRR